MAQFASIFDIPRSQRAICAAGKKLMTIRRRRECRHRAGVTFEFLRTVPHRAGGNVPEADQSIPPADRNLFADVYPCDATDIRGHDGLGEERSPGGIRDAKATI